MQSFLKKKNLSIIVSRNNIKKYNKLINSVFFFLNKKYIYSLSLKFGKVLVDVYGLNVKFNVLKFVSFYGFSYNYKLLFSLEKERTHFFTNIQEVFRNLYVGYSLQKYVVRNIYRQYILRLYSGYRHKLCLPVRGQRTKTNAGTQKRKYQLLIEDGSGGRKRKRKRIRAKRKEIQKDYFNRTKGKVKSKHKKSRKKKK